MKTLNIYKNNIDFYTAFLFGPVLDNNIFVIKRKGSNVYMCFKDKYTNMRDPDTVIQCDFCIWDMENGTMEPCVKNNTMISYSDVVANDWEIYVIKE